MSRFRAFARGALSVFDFPFDIFGSVKPPEIIEPADIPHFEHPAGVRVHKTSEEAFTADSKAIASDWKRVGNHIRSAMGQHEQKKV